MYCSNNQITQIDVSTYSELCALNCSNNELAYLNMKNGNNPYLSCWAKNNDDLYCVEVDNPEWSQENWTNRFDIQSTFFEFCECTNYVSGTIYANTFCLFDGNEVPLAGVIVKSDPDNSFGVTDSLGNYRLLVDSGFFHVSQVLSNPLISPLCPSVNYHTVYFDTVGLGSPNRNFFNKTIECPLLSVELSSDRRRRCFTNNTFVEYCNQGFSDASNVELVVQFPEYINFISSDYPYTENDEGHFVFYIGDLAAQNCGTIHIVDSVSCEEGITGRTLCTEAWILPNNDCLDAQEVNSNWDQSSISVEGECIDGTLVQFIISNLGEFSEADMQNEHEYRIFADNELQLIGQFQLNGEENVIVEYPANGQTIRLEADQHPEHPGNSNPEKTIEVCGNDNGTVSLGFVDDLPQDDADFDVEIDCMEIIDSYDPNDKRVSPEGITDQNFIQAGELLEYQIRFQNTGTDTAYKVVVIDTLSSNLDPSTIEWGISSNDYTVNVSGVDNPVLRFTFNNINLPDSSENELASNGFVKFKVAIYENLNNGSEIENTAHIFFDYNSAILTNTCWLVVSDTALIANEIVKVETLDVVDCKIFPNPSYGSVYVESDLLLSVKVYNISGQLVKCSLKKEIDLSEQPEGIYFIKVKTKKGVASEKIILIK